MARSGAERALTQLVIASREPEAADTPEWQQVCAAMNEMLARYDVEVDDLAWLIRVMPYADDCPKCPVASTAFPVGVRAESDGTAGLFSYHCQRCGHVWTCWYSTAAVELMQRLRLS